MANHIPTNTASSTIRGGLLGGIVGFLTIPALVAGGAALAATAGMFGGAIALSAGIGGLASLVAFSTPLLPLNWGMAAYGAAGGGLFGAARGVETGQAQNVQDQARSAYINGYAQTRAGLEAQMAMAAQSPMPQAFDANAVYHPAMAANENNPTLMVNAEGAEHMGTQLEATQALGKA